MQSCSHWLGFLYSEIFTADRAGEKKSVAIHTFFSKHFTDLQILNSIFSLAVIIAMPKHETITLVCVVAKEAKNNDSLNIFH